MERLAIIGTGIAGMGCAYFLHKHFNITMFEKNDYMGGHSNTVALIDEDETQAPIDTGFIVYNHINYPNLVRFFKELHIKERKVPVTFSIQHIPSGLEFSGPGWKRIFVQRMNFVNAEFRNLLQEIKRFNDTCVEVLAENMFLNCTVESYLSLKKYSSDFTDKYLLPISSAAWSTPHYQMLDFPIRTLVGFFYNHGLLGNGHDLEWYTVEGGSSQYRDKILTLMKGHIEYNTSIAQLRRDEKDIYIRSKDGREFRFDKVILATHADEALAILSPATELETRLLQPFTYQLNTISIHTDERVMPKSRQAWSSWNFRIDHDVKGKDLPAAIFWMNNFQNIASKKNYFLSIHDPGYVDRTKILKEIDYWTPVFTLDTMRVRKDLPKLNDNGKIFFCGSYYRFGFHEDAFTSALHCSRKILNQPIWK